MPAMRFPLSAKKAAISSPISFGQVLCWRAWKECATNAEVCGWRWGFFQYTDGVTEAANRDNELYGMERLAEILGQHSERPPADLLPKVKEDIDRFVGEAPQFDDITMLCLEYRAKMEE